MKGFTLLEMLIYIALLSLLIAGSLEAAYQLAVNAEASRASSLPEREGEFVLRKLEYALYGMSAATLPSGSDVHITKYDGTQTDFSLASGTIMIAENGGVPEALTDSDVRVSNLHFSLIAAHGTVPFGLTADAVINGIDFTITRYAK